MGFDGKFLLINVVQFIEIVCDLSFVQGAGAWRVKPNSISTHNPCPFLSTLARYTYTQSHYLHTNTQPNWQTTRTSAQHRINNHSFKITRTMTFDCRAKCAEERQQSSDKNKQGAELSFQIATLHFSNFIQINYTLLRYLAEFVSLIFYTYLFDIFFLFLFFITLLDFFSIYFS